jgi:hypothetical protein
MTRIDKPTLQCDRCEKATADLGEMASFMQLYSPKPSDRTDKWDLCPKCSWAFINFMENRDSEG